MLFFLIATVFLKHVFLNCYCVGLHSAAANAACAKPNSQQQKKREKVQTSVQAELTSHQYKVRYTEWEKEGEGVRGKGGRKGGEM